MVGISAKDLPYEELHVGDVIEYYSQTFVCGDRRGHRVTTVLSIDQLEESPVTIATEEILTLSTLIKRVRDSAGMSVEWSKWRKIRSFTLSNGNISLPTDRERLGERMTTIVTEVIGSIRRSGAASDSPDPVIEDHTSAACSLARTCSSFHQDGSTATRKGPEDPQTRSPAEAVDESKVVDEGEGRWKISERMCFTTGQLAVQAVKHLLFIKAKTWWSLVGAEWTAS
ncbi:hypothetical protein PHMEG_00022770 [Phytophthora megakarya]|uniref:Uncharacterized protein n=1 Tax=Phytophthora megakarya TaxID=4795 RepID=A0A225VJA4_9STRA|nr:hypothetical protein PHMEG_00022770 [Phytophthora megakarya]